MLIPVCSSRGTMGDLLGLWCVALCPIALHDCVFKISRGCRYSLGHEPGTVYPPAPTSLRPGVLPWCSFSFVHQFMCFVYGSFIYGEGVYISTFPCVQSMCRSSPLIGTTNLVGSGAVVSRSPRDAATGFSLLWSRCLRGCARLRLGCLRVFSGDC